ncbi:hypothetical protein NQZ68_022119 [Dissostichus eleginoides]|nr:hypothetical protein NQZ68_022119 [Dissostichus eleginoides]
MALSSPGHVRNHCEPISCTYCSPSFISESLSGISRHGDGWRSCSQLVPVTKQNLSGTQSEDWQDTDTCQHSVRHTSLPKSDLSQVTRDVAAPPDQLPLQDQCVFESGYHAFTGGSIGEAGQGGSKLSRALSQSGKRALPEESVYSRVEDTVRVEGHKGKSELEKHSRGLEGGGGGRGGGIANSASTCGEKHSARQALKLHSKAAGVKRCQSCETHRTHLSPKLSHGVRET